jgi:hypothetical protein
MLTSCRCLTELASVRYCTPWELLVARSPSRPLQVFPQFASFRVSQFGQTATETVQVFSPSSKKKTPSVRSNTAWQWGQCVLGACWD